MNKHLQFFVLLLLYIISLNIVEADITSDTKKYELSSDKTSWSSAKRACESNGGYLITITSYEESQIAKSVANSGGNKDNVWIGLREENLEGEFLWVTGEPFLFTNWGSFQPNGDSDLSCVWLNKSDRKWNDQRCSTSITKKFICEYDLNQKPNIPSNPQPVDNADEVDLETTLSWTGGDPDFDDSVEYDIYFGETLNPPKVKTHSLLTYNPGKIKANSLYCWKIVSRDNHGAEKQGQLWRFTTKAPQQCFTQDDLDKIVTEKNLIIQEKNQVIADKDILIASMFTKEQMNDALAEKEYIISEKIQKINSILKRYDINQNDTIGVLEAINALKIVSGLNIPINSFKPQVGIYPAFGFKGTVFQEPGTGFSSNSSATLYFVSPVGLGEPIYKQTDGAGSFKHSWICNDCPVGLYKYWAIDKKTGVKTNTVYFEIKMITPRVGVYPKSGHIGDTFYETGNDFTPNSSVHLYFKGPDGNENSLIKETTNEGTYYHSWVCKDCPVGIYEYWGVDSATLKVSEKIVFSVINNK